MPYMLLVKVLPLKQTAFKKQNWLNNKTGNNDTHPQTEERKDNFAPCLLPLTTWKYLAFIFVSLK